MVPRLPPFLETYGYMRVTHSVPGLDVNHRNPEDSNRNWSTLIPHFTGCKTDLEGVCVGEGNCAHLTIGA